MTDLYQAIRKLTDGAQIRRTGEGYAWDWNVDPHALDSLLGPVALSAAELLVSKDLGLVGQCATTAAAAGCSWTPARITAAGGATQGLRKPGQAAPVPGTRPQTGLNQYFPVTFHLMIPRSVLPDGVSDHHLAESIVSLLLEKTAIQSWNPST